MEVRFFSGRGRPGDEESSNAGRRVGAGRLTPAVGGNDRVFILLGEESIMTVARLKARSMCCKKKSSARVSDRVWDADPKDAIDIGRLR